MLFASQPIQIVKANSYIQHSKHFNHQTDAFDIKDALIW